NGQGTASAFETGDRAGCDRKRGRFTLVPVGWLAARDSQHRKGNPGGIIPRGSRDPGHDPLLRDQRLSRLVPVLQESPNVRSHTTDRCCGVGIRRLDRRRRADPWSGPGTATSATRRPFSPEPAVSPDRNEIAFASGGDIWTAPLSGGDARLLVSHVATES